MGVHLGFKRRNRDLRTEGFGSNVLNCFVFRTLATSQERTEGYICTLFLWGKVFLNGWFWPKQRFKLRQWNIWYTIKKICPPLMRTWNNSCDLLSGGGSLIGIFERLWAHSKQKRLHNQNQKNIQHSCNYGKLRHGRDIASPHPWENECVIRPPKSFPTKEITLHTLVLGAGTLCLFGGCIIIYC